VYALGVSLVRSNASWPLTCLLPAELASDAQVRFNLTAAGFNYVRVVDEIINPAITVGKLSQIHKTGIFTKLVVFDLIEYDQLIYLDADTVVNRNIDELFASTKEEFAAVPEIMARKACDDDASEHLFVEEGVEYCRSHSKTPYHGRVYVYSNSGVMVVRPRRATFDALLALLRDEVTHDDSCIGQPGCNDQRLINIYFSRRRYRQLPLLYNVYCDKYLTEQYVGVPYVFHYRGGNADKWSVVSDGMKPWIMEPGSDALSWIDLCHRFLDNHIEFERRWALALPIASEARALSRRDLEQQYIALRQVCDSRDLRVRDLLSRSNRWRPISSSALRATPRTAAPLHCSSCCRRATPTCAPPPPTRSSPRDSPPRDGSPISDSGSTSNCSDGSN
jgi:hypothetical protein